MYEEFEDIHRGIKEAYEKNDVSTVCVLLKTLPQGRYSVPGDIASELEASYEALLDIRKNLPMNTYSLDLVKAQKAFDEVWSLIDDLWIQPQ